MNKRARTNPILVTGAAGFIGFHTIERLLREGVSVVGVDNFDNHYERYFKEANVRDLQRISQQVATPFEFHEKDVRDLDTSFCPSDHFDSVIHLAARAGSRTSLGNWPMAISNNLDGTLKTLAFAKERMVSQFVFGSSASVYGADTPLPFKESAPADQPQSPYAATKRACELVCHEYAFAHGMKVASVRLFSVFGPRQRPDQAIRLFCWSASEGIVVPLFGDGTSSRDFTYVSDVVDGIIAGLDFLRDASKGTFEIFNLGTSKETSLKELVTCIETATGLAVTCETKPAFLAETNRECADLSKSQDLLGYSPKVSFAEGLRRYVDWFLGHSQTYKEAA